MTSRTNYYKSVSQIYKFRDFDDINSPAITTPYDNSPNDIINLIRSNKSEEDVIDIDNSDIRLNSNIAARIYVPDEDIVPEKTEYFEQSCTYHDKKANNNPVIWGPPFWYTLHNGAFHYPKHASPLYSERMKNFILGLPIMVPCVVCKEHATAFIEKHRNKLNDICSNRDDLFKFFVDFHNQVNKRYNKPILSYEDAYSIYN